MSPEPSPGTDLLVIMAKEPRPGEVKTRLQPNLTAQEAAELYRRLLLDRLDEMRSLSPVVSVAVAFSPPSAEDAFASLAPPPFLLLPQGEGTLSQRLAIVFARGFGLGCRAVAVVDSDSPELSAEHVLRSFRRLADGADVVFGPSRDGGYYLVGLRESREELFQDVPWSTEGVLSFSLDRARELGLRAGLLERLRDIDTIADLAGFYRDRSGASGREKLPGRRAFGFVRSLCRQGRLEVRRGGSETS